jgi:hypothetical protein
MYVIYLIGSFCFLVGGILMVANHHDSITKRLSSGLPLIIAQSICGIISSIIFIKKMKNYCAAKRAKISELLYCQQLKKNSDQKKQLYNRISVSKSNKKKDMKV